MNGFCMKCGAKLIDGVCKECSIRQKESIKEPTKSKGQEKFRRFFTNSNEELVATLGNSYFETFINNGDIKKAFAIVSNKRAYFQGTSYDVHYKSNGKKKLVKTSKSRTIDLKDVTGTGSDTYTRPIYRVLSVLFMLPIFFTTPAVFILSDGLIVRNALILSVIFLALAIWMNFLYQKLLDQYISIQYAGGEIAFNLLWYSHDEVSDFQKQLRLAKDKALEDTENAVANKLQGTISNAMASNADNRTANGTADELIKYGQLLHNGLLTQEEYEKIKKELLHL